MPWCNVLCYFQSFLFLCPKKFGNQAHKSHSCTALQFLKWLYFSGTQLRPWLGLGLRQIPSGSKLRQQHRKSKQKHKLLWQGWAKFSVCLNTRMEQNRGGMLNVEFFEGSVFTFQFYHSTSPKGFSASKCDVGNWIFSI